MPGYIFVVDDDHDIRDALESGLDLLGYRVISASNGQEALEKLSQLENIPCMIFLDLMMPIMNGSQFRQRQVADPKLATVPVIVITADSDVRLKTAELRVNEVLQKPFDFSMLAQVAERYCGRAENLLC